jgi:hypothetical protein
MDRRTEGGRVRLARRAWCGRGLLCVARRGRPRELHDLGLRLASGGGRLERRTCANAEGAACGCGVGMASGCDIAARRLYVAA